MFISGLFEMIGIWLNTGEALLKPYVCNKEPLPLFAEGGVDAASIVFGGGGKFGNSLVNMAGVEVECLWGDDGAWRVEGVCALFNTGKLALLCVFLWVLLFFEVSSFCGLWKIFEALAFSFLF